MITYRHILSDQTVIDEYAKIDIENPYPFSHGFQHIKNVVEIMKKITKILNISGRQRQSLLIACVLHDIGLVGGREGHESRARIFSQKYLQNNIPQADLKDILSAIEGHDQEVHLEELPLFTNLVCFADKMDFSSKRLIKDYEDKFGHLIYEDIVDIKFEYFNGYFSILISTNQVDNAIELLKERSFFKKVITSGLALSKKLNVTFKILVDQKEVDISLYIAHAQV